MRKNRLKVIQAAIVFFTTVFFAYNDIQAQDGLTPVPDGKQGFIYSPAAAPENNSDPSLAKPVGIGSFAAGGDILSIQISLNQFAGSVDVYGAYKISTDPDHVNILMPGSISFAAFTLSEIAAALSSGMPPAGAHPWKANTSGPINESLFDLPVSNIPQGAYSVYLLVTPAGNLESYYLWETFFRGI